MSRVKIHKPTFLPNTRELVRATVDRLKVSTMYEDDDEFVRSLGNAVDILGRAIGQAYQTRTDKQNKVTAQMRAERERW